MFDLDKAFLRLPVESIDKDGWSVTDYDRFYTAAGNHIKVGMTCRLFCGATLSLGDRVTIGDDVVFWNKVKVGNNTTIGNKVVLLTCVELGNNVTIESGVVLPKYLVVVDNTVIGEGAKDIVDLHRITGEHVYLAQVDGVAYIGGNTWRQLREFLDELKYKRERPCVVWFMDNVTKLAKKEKWLI